MKEINWTYLEKPFLTNTAEILGGLVKDSTLENPDQGLGISKNPGRNSRHLLHSVFTPEKEAMVNYGPSKTVFRTPFPRSAALITVPKMPWLDCEQLFLPVGSEVSSGKERNS